MLPLFSFPTLIAAEITIGLRLDGLENGEARMHLRRAAADPQLRAGERTRRRASKGSRTALKNNGSVEALVTISRPRLFRVDITPRGRFFGARASWSCLPSGGDPRGPRLDPSCFIGIVSVRALLARSAPSAKLAPVRQFRSGTEMGDGDAADVRASPSAMTPTACVIIHHNKVGAVIPCAISSTTLNDLIRHQSASCGDDHHAQFEAFPRRSKLVTSVLFDKSGINGGAVRIFAKHFRFRAITGTAPIVFRPDRAAPTATFLGKVDRVSLTATFRCDLSHPAATFFHRIELARSDR